MFKLKCMIYIVFLDKVYILYDAFPVTSVQWIFHCIIKYYKKGIQLEETGEREEENQAYTQSTRHPSRDAHHIVGKDCIVSI